MASQLYAFHRKVALDKASGLPYIFVRVITGHTPFQLERIGMG